MFDDTETQPAESSPVTDAQVASSTAEVQPAEGTAQKPVEPKEEPPFHEHPRFKELISEKRELQEQNKQLLETLRSMPRQEQAAVIEQKEYLANTPEEKEFWRTVEATADRLATKKIAEKEKQFSAQIGAVYKQVGAIAAKEFLKDHPDVKRESDDLKDIVALSSQRGLDLDEAYKIVMFDKAQQLAVEKEKTKQQQNVKARQAANVETSSIPHNSIIKPKDASLESAMDAAAKELGLAF